MNQEETILGDYILLEQKGKGSLGSLFLAEHRIFKRPYAVKILSEALSRDIHFLTRFEKEMAQVALLDHPQIVKVHNISSAADRYYLVTDFIADNTNLFQFLKKYEAPFTEAQLMHLVRQLASAIDYAHDLGITHQGIKLNNILVQKTPQGLSLILSDFAFAKVLGIKAVLKQSFDAMLDTFRDVEDQMAFWQNYSFLAPEQKAMLPHVGKEVDTYAFGVLVYYMIHRSFPEGIIDFSLFAELDYSFPWDVVVRETMQREPQKRPQQLTSFLDSLSKEDSKPKPLLKPQEIHRPEYEEDPGSSLKIEAKVALYQPQAPLIKEQRPLLTEMVIIEGGQHYRGSLQGARDETPRHLITLSSFAIDIHPVTNEQFVRFLEAMGGEKDVNNNDILRLKESRIKKNAGNLSIESGYHHHPVVGITWYGAIAYAKWVGKRLPTEAEWEIAAYGGHFDYIYPCGYQIERSQANFFSSDTVAVMSYDSNGYGLYDMAGNVYEWCADWYGHNYYQISAQEPKNPQGPPQGVYRVLRGGCWKSSKEDVRCAHRHRNNPGTVNSTYGLRCAADVSS